LVELRSLPERPGARADAANVDICEEVEHAQALLRLNDARERLDHLGLAVVPVLRDAEHREVTVDEELDELRDRLVESEPFADDDRGLSAGDRVVIGALRAFADVVKEESEAKREEIAHAPDHLSEAL